MIGIIVFTFCRKIWIGKVDERPIMRCGNIQLMRWVSTQDFKTIFSVKLITDTDDLD
jgi:hypothetical protein